MREYNLFLQHLCFHLEPKETLYMPAFNKGNVIRGAFGSTFRRIVCHSACKGPETCDLRFVCPYTVIFNPFVPEGSEKVSKNRDIPRPFVIKPPLETKEIYGRGERLSFDLVVVGKAKDYLPYFIVTFKELCWYGLGRNRTRCDLVRVEALSLEGEPSLVYSGGDNLVRPPTEDISWGKMASGVLGHGRKEVEKITLRFLTPTTLKADGVLVRRPTFSALIRRLRDRINGLSYFYCGEGLEIDFKQLGDDAEGVRTIEDSTRWVDVSRYSRRRDISHDLSGFVGAVTFEGEISPFMPYLMLGEYLHVGKNAVFGNGWFQIEECVTESA